ncbi:signal peptidase I [Kocuria turfanensis]|uniref:Signal peptidase I n=1 Tax=Kocuria turfanensis TaxID=388357 RepID=A0A512I9I8_9MICC|nr:signal peptidase I [Kocuria turfanensis]GEO94364.1 signal peptidase I [Kocuria turfanensis]
MTAPAGTARRARPGRAGTAAGLLVVAAVVALRLWVVEPLVVGSDSMEPTLPEGGLVLLLKSGSPQERAVPGALVVLAGPDGGHSTVKRVVASGGQTVAIQDSVLVVDGAPVPEPFVDHDRIDGTWFGPVTVPPEHVFVLGDNRSPSVDSRDYGSVPLSVVEATVLLPRGP